MQAVLLEEEIARQHRAELRRAAVRAAREGRPRRSWTLMRAWLGVIARHG